MATNHFEELRRLAISDDHAIDRALSETRARELLDAETRALVRIAALVALDAAESSLLAAIESAEAAGVERDRIVELTLALEPIIGPDRVEVALPLIKAG